MISRKRVLGGSVVLSLMGVALVMVLLTALVSAQERQILGPAENVKAKPYAKGSVTVTWDDVLFAQSYLVRYGTGDTVSTTQVGNVNSTNITGLTCTADKTTYTFNVAGLAIPQGSSPLNVDNFDWANATSASATLLCPSTVTVKFTDNAETVTEGDSHNDLMVQTDPATDETFNISITRSGTAETGDYNVSPTTLSFSYRETSRTITITTDQDGDCDDETGTLGFTSLPPFVTPVNPKTFTLTIDDDESLDDCTEFKVDYGASSYDGGEGDTKAVTLTITPNPTTQTFIVPLTATNGSAESADYSRSATNVTFSSSNTSPTFDITYNEDANDCDDETLTLGFGSPMPPGVSVGTTNPTASVTISDNDECLLKFSDSEYTGSEGVAQSITVEYHSTFTTAQEVTIPVSVESGAATIRGSDVVLSPWADSATFRITPARDSDCNNETVTIALGSPDGNNTGTTTPHTAEITVTDTTPKEDCDGDPPPPPPPPATVTFPSCTPTSVTISWSAVTDAERYKVERKQGLSGTWVDEEDEINGTTHTATGLAQDTRYYFRVSARGDGDPYSTTYGATTPQKSQHTGATECAVPPPPTKPAVSFASSTYSVNEGSSVAIGLELSKAHTSSVTVTVKFSKGSTDKNAVFPAGSTTATVTFAAIEDDDDDFDETITASFKSLPSSVTSGSPSIANIEVADNDPPGAPTGLHGNGNIVSNHVTVWWDAWHSAANYVLRYAVDCEEARRYRVPFTCSAIEDDDWTELPPLAKTVTETTIQVGGTGTYVLDKYVSYRIEVQATNTKGDGSWSDWAIITPTDEVPRFSTRQDWRDGEALNSSAYPVPSRTWLHGYQAPTTAYRHDDFTYGVCESSVPSALINALDVDESAATVASEIATAVEKWEDALKGTRTANLISIRKIALSDRRGERADCSQTAVEEQTDELIERDPPGLPVVGKNAIVFVNDRTMWNARCDGIRQIDPIYAGCYRTESLPEWAYRPFPVDNQPSDVPPEGGALPRLEGGWIMLREGYVPGGDPAHWAGEVGERYDKCPLYVQRAMHEVGHALGLGVYWNLWIESHGTAHDHSLMTAGDVQDDIYYCSPQAYDIGALMVNYQSR